MPYAKVKIGVNSIADIPNCIYIGIGNSIVRNNSMPNDIVKANTKIIMPESDAGLHMLI